MEYAELIELARELEGRDLQTVTGTKFKVGVYMDCPFFIPESTGLGRSDGRRAAEQFLEIFNETGSLNTSDYKHVTRNASYYIPLVTAK